MVHRCFVDVAEAKDRESASVLSRLPGWIVEIETPSGNEPVWDLDRILALLDHHRAGWPFRAGADYEIVTTAPLADVVAALEHVAGGVRRASG